MYGVLAKQFPAAELVASTFDDYVGQLEAAAPGLDLEVFTGKGLFCVGVVGGRGGTGEGYRGVLLVGEGGRG